MSMALKEEELALIGEYVQSHLNEWLPLQLRNLTGSIYPIELSERIVRVEEELKNQRELMKQGFDQMDKRFELTQNSMDKRFNEVNTRLENISAKMFHFMIWSFGFTATIAGIVIGVIKFM